MSDRSFQAVEADIKEKIQREGVAPGKYDPPSPKIWERISGAKRKGAKRHRRKAQGREERNPVT